MIHTIKGPNGDVTYQEITQQEAKALIDSKEPHTILDVRHEEEFEAGHIDGALLIPNENILPKPLPELPDLNRTILVYCRSGQRSKIASKKLALAGYTDIRDFGGYMNWPYK